FAVHRSLQDGLAEVYPQALKITADMSPEARQDAVDAFQTDPTKQLIIVSMGAGKEGITLTAASNVLFCELDWRPADHDQAEDRVRRIGQKNACTAYYALDENTIDADQMDLIDGKEDVIQAAMASETFEALRAPQSENLDPEAGSVVRHLLALLAAKPLSKPPLRKRQALRPAPQHQEPLAPAGHSKMR
ncbi:MAG: C-terminal helicase domain-containing protein, partial [Burkholderiaceae bacterium]